MSSQAVPQGYKQTRVGVVPEEWGIISFGSLAEFRNGLNFTQKNSGEAIKIVGVANFKKYSVLPTLKDLDIINVSKMVKENDLIKDNDVLYVRSNGNKNLIGRCLYFPQVDEKLSFSGFTIRGRVISPLINPKYFALLSNSKIVKKQFSNNGAGTNISNLSQQILNNVLIPLPSLKEQQKIAKILTTWDDAISKQEALIEEKEQLKKGLMQRLLSGEVRFDGFYEEWEEVRLGDVGEVISGLTYSPKNIDKNGILVLRSSNVQKRKLAFDDNVYVNTTTLKFNPVEENDILICVRNGSKSLIGKNALINKENKGVAFGAFMSVFRSQHNIFLFQLFDTHIYKREVHRNLGATINSINGSDLKKFKIPFPPLQEQQKIAQVLSTTDKEIELLKKEFEALKEQKRGLMQRLLTGEVRVRV